MTDRNYKNITLALPVELHKYLKRLKKENFTSLSALVTHLLMEWREKNGK